jgi:hypothetical protein
MADQQQQNSQETDRKKEQESAQSSARKHWMIFSFLGALAIIALALLVNLNARGTRSVFSPKQDKFIPPEPGTWRFIVSGDSRNCGDVVVPTIAADSLAKYQPSFYWHLGDLRAIYKIDEDMAAAAQQSGQSLSCKTYFERAWPDFIDNQIRPFGNTRFYLGIGNHEVIKPMTRDQFSSVFEDWLATPRRLMERTEAQQIASAKSGPCVEIANKPYVTNLTYYHFIQGVVDFIYLDNASGSFSYPMEKPAGSYSRDQVSWFDCILERATNNPSIATVVVGMHEALPYSRANDHSMCDDPTQKTEGCETGKHVYEALLKLHEKKNVYVLASHSHFYMDKLFDDQPPGHRLPGWIVGTAGAIRYPLPPHVDPGPGAQRDVYGYLLATVEPNGEIDFDFKEVKETDVPAEVRKRYPSALLGWCFAHNSQNKDPLSEETTNRCVGPVSSSKAGQKSALNPTDP